MKPTRLRRAALVALAVVTLAACSDDESSSESGDGGDPPSPFLPADPAEPGSGGAAALGASTTVPMITAPPVSDVNPDCPDGRVRWVTERATIEDERQGDPSVWRVTVVGRVENRTSERIVPNIQDLEIFIYRPPAWDGLTPYYASAPVDAGSIAPGDRSPWRVNVTVQSESRPRIGSVRANPTWADERISRTCPQPTGEGAKPRPA